MNRSDFERILDQANRAASALIKDQIEVSKLPTVGSCEGMKAIANAYIKSLQAEAASARIAIDEFVGVGAGR